MTKYDPTVLQKYADRMYLRANSILLSYGLLGLLLGLAWAFIINLVFADRFRVRPGSGGLEMMPQLVWIGLPTLCVVFGIFLGIEKAFWLKLEAQRVLCQLQIEANTFRGADPMNRMGGSVVAPEVQP